MVKRNAIKTYRVVGAPNFSGGSLPMRYFESRPYAIGYNGRTGLSGNNWLTTALKKYALPALKKHALPALKKHGLATVANAAKNLSENQPIFQAVKNALGTQVKTVLGSKKSIKAAKKRRPQVSRQRVVKTKQRAVRRKGKKNKVKRVKSKGFKELVL